MWSAITAVTRSPDTREVVVAARDLPSGSTVGAADLATRRVARDSLPAGLVRRIAIEGRTLSGAMRSGEVFTDRRVVDPRDVGSGRVLAVVEVAAATGAMLRPGDAVDLVAVGEDGVGTTVAEAVEVVTVRTEAEREAAVLGVAAAPRTATAVARASMTSRLAAVVVPRH